MSRIARAARAGIGLLGSVLILALGAAILGVASERGSRLTAAAIADVSGGMLQFERFDGRLAGAFEIRGLRVTLPDFSFRCDDFVMEWRPSALIERVFRVRRVAVHRPLLEISTGERAQTALPPLPSLPVAIVVDEFVTNHATLIRGTQTTVIERLELAAEWRRARIAIGRLAGRYGAHRLSGYLALDVRREPRLAARFDWTGPLTGVDSRATVSLVGPLQAAVLNIEFDSIVTGSVAGTLALDPERPAFDLGGKLDPVSIPVSDDDAVELEQIAFTVAGGLDQIAIESRERVRLRSGPQFEFIANARVTPDDGDFSSLTAAFDWRAMPLSGTSFPALSARGRLRYANGMVEIEHHTEPPYRTAIVATVAADPDRPSLEATVSWSDIALRLADDLVIASPAATASVSGVLPEVDIVMTAAVEEARTGRSELELRGRADPARLRLDRLAAKTLGGELTVDGRIDWSPTMQARLAVAGTDIDLGRLRPETPTRLSFSGEVEIEQPATGFEAELRVASLSGTWRGQTITGTGRLRIEPGAATVDEFDLSAGANTVFLSGTLSERIEGSFRLALPDLSVFDARLRGELTGSGRFSGARSAPAVQATVAGRDLAWEAAGIGELAADVDVDLSQDLDSTLTIRASAIDYAGRHLDSAVLRGHGTKGAHAITVDLTAANAGTRMAVDGAWTGSVWKATIAEQHIEAAGFGRWILDEPARLEITRDPAVRLTRMCLAQEAGRICAEKAHWSPVASQATVNYAGLPLALLDRWLPPNVRADGTVSGAVVVHREGADMTLSGHTEARDARLLASGLGDFARNMPVEGFVARYEMSPRAYRAVLSATIPALLTINADLNIDRSRNDDLYSELKFNSNDLSWLADVFPALHGTAGTFELEATASGPLKAPQLRARGRLGAGQVALPDIGLRLAALEFSARSEGQRTVRFDGRVLAGQRPLDVSGQVTLDPDQGWPYRVAVRGDDFPLVRLPEMELDISPDVLLEARRGIAHASGRISIPHLYFELLALPETATAVSEDQVLIAPDGDPIAQPESGEPPLVFYRERFTADIDLVLGDDIEIKGLGLTTALTGGVRLHKDPGHLGQADGKVTVKSGLFKAYGQKLTIEKGHLLFAGPVDNPSLSIRAVRPNIDVVAGVRVTGTARDPRFAIFSEPPMSDAEKLSYILTGRPMTDASKGDGSLIAQAALGFGLEHSSMITNEVRDLFQLDELGISGGGTMADTAVVAGKQLSPRLSVRSEMNLFDQLWSFFLRYKLTDSWSVEAESGVRQGADVIYSIERDSLLGGSQ